MNREKQIEEMAKLTCNSQRSCYKGDCIGCEICAVRENCEKLYNADYRKQVKGEWRKVYQNDKATVYECSNCHHLSFGTSDYCICGAMMKGSEDDA